MQMSLGRRIEDNNQADSAVCVVHKSWIPYTWVMTSARSGRMLDKLGLGVFNYNNAVRGSDVVRTDRVDHF